MKPSERLAQLQHDITEPFQPSMFSTSRLPVSLGPLNHTIGRLPSCLDMLIKLPKQDKIIPEPYQDDVGIRAFVEIAMMFEDKILPGWRDTHHLYLTVDQRIVKKDHTHRNAGWHFDGMQGTRHKTKLNACHQYVLSTDLPTEFTSQPTNAMDLCEHKDNWFESLGAQVHDQNLWQPEPLEMVLMSAYQLHRSVQAPKDTPRTFLRLDVSLKQQDRLGNTENPDLPAPWPFVERPMPPHLDRGVHDTGWENEHAFETDKQHHGNR